MVEEDRVVCIRFGHDHNEDCMAMDETLYGVSEKVQNFAIIYLGTSNDERLGVVIRDGRVSLGDELMSVVDITEVPDFNKVCLALLFDPPIPPKSCFALHSYPVGLDLMI